MKISIDPGSVDAAARGIGAAETVLEGVNGRARGLPSPKGVSGATTGAIGDAIAAVHAIGDCTNKTAAEMRASAALARLADGGSGGRVSGLAALLANVHALGAPLRSPYVLPPKKKPPKGPSPLEAFVNGVGKELETQGKDLIEMPGGVLDMAIHPRQTAESLQWIYENPEAFLQALIAGGYADILAEAKRGNEAGAAGQGSARALLALIPIGKLAQLGKLNKLVKEAKKLEKAAKAKGIDNPLGPAAGTALGVAFKKRRGDAIAQARKGRELRKDAAAAGTPAERRRLEQQAADAERQAKELYREAKKLDGYQGTYEQFLERQDQINGVAEDGQAIQEAEEQRRKNEL